MILDGSQINHKLILILCLDTSFDLFWLEERSSIWEFTFLSPHIHHLQFTYVEKDLLDLLIQDTQQMLKTLQITLFI